MDSRNLIEMAALVASKSHDDFAQGHQLPEIGMQRYWTASKCRLQRWLRSLRNCSVPFHAKPTPAMWQLFQPLAEEILAGEVLTRVWAGISIANDKQNGISEAQPVAHSILIGHLDARIRVLQLLVLAQQHGISEANEVNKLRRCCERWTDMLLGYLASDYNVAHLAFDRPRVMQFAQDIRSNPKTKSGDPVELLTSIRESFDFRRKTVSPNADLNRQIASSIMSCYCSDFFDSMGGLKTVWLDRLNHTASDTLSMIGELLELELESHVGTQ